MNLRSAASLAVFASAAVGLSGCSHPYYAPPPPPVVYQPGPALLDVAARNGFNAGVSDGSRASYYGYRYEPRRTPAYHNTPGYDPNLGPYGPYSNAFRNSYLRGYDQGYYHR